MENQELETDSFRKLLGEQRRKHQELIEKHCSRPLAKIPDFPETREQFIAKKPIDISFYNWLTHPSNEFAFQDMVFKVLDLIKKNTDLGWCRLKLTDIASKIGINERRLRTILNKLQQIAIIQSCHICGRRWLRILKNAFD